MPKVSVIIPTYNRADLLRTAISSALNQTFSDFEIVVVDDRSTDHTQDIIKSFKDNRIKYILNTGKKGPSAARNSAILMSKSEYIAFLDDDDEWLPEKLHRQVELIDQSGSDVCGVHTNIIKKRKETGKIIFHDRGTKKLKGNLLDQLSVGGLMITPTILLRKKCLDQIGLFDETISYMEDRDLWIRLSMKWDFEYIPDPLVIVYLHEKEHLSTNIEAQVLGKEALYNRYPSLFKKNRKQWSEYLRILGLQYCQLEDMKKGRKNIIKSIMNSPFIINNYPYLVAAFLPPNLYKKLRMFAKTNFITKRWV